MATEESPEDRFARDYEEMGTVDTDGNPDDRKDRELDQQSAERQSRLYVDPETIDHDDEHVIYSGTSATGVSYDPEA
jgi:hypothetical protein